MTPIIGVKTGDHLQFLLFAILIIHHEFIARHTVLFPSGCVEEIDKLRLTVDEDVFHCLRPFRGVSAEDDDGPVDELEFDLFVRSVKIIDFTDG